MSSERIIFLTIIALPILDISTAYTKDLPLSAGAFVRSLLMAGLLCSTLIYFFKTKQTKYYYTYLAAIFVIFLSFSLNLYQKQDFLLGEEINFLLKTIYMITMLYTALWLLQKHAIKTSTLLQATSWAAIILAVTYWGAILLKLDQASYAFDKLGSSGPFFAANELSVIVLVLVTSSMIAVIFQPTNLHIIAYLSLFTVIPMIGTKTALYGGMFLLSLTVFTLPFVMQKKKQLIIALAALIFFILIPSTPGMKNQEVKEATTHEVAENTHHKQVDLLSSRDIYVSQLQQNFTVATPLRKLFGLGYGGDQAVAKMAEMDFYDLFFAYGYVGTVFLLIPFLLTIISTIKLPIKLASFLLILTIPLWLGISYTAGHVLFAPAVMSYMAIFLLLLGLIQQQEVSNEAVS